MPDDLPRGRDEERLRKPCDPVAVRGPGVRVVDHGIGPSVLAREAPRVLLAPVDAQPDEGDAAPAPSLPGRLHEARVRPAWGALRGPHVEHDGRAGQPGEV